MPGIKGEGKSPKTLKTYETSFNSFENYLEDNGIKFVDEVMCLEYIQLKTGQRFSGFACVTSNTRVDCFPAIPTMAEQLHISVSTVKRALKELVEDDYIQKEARSRANNRGQSSNLYTLILFEQAQTGKRKSRTIYALQFLFL